MEVQRFTPVDASYGLSLRLINSDSAQTDI